MTTDRRGIHAVIAPSLESLAVPVDNLTPDPNNARRGDVAAIRRSLSVFGQRKPVVVRRVGQDADGRPTGIVIAGNHTLAAAVELHWDHVAAIFVDDDETTAKAYALADNRTGELAAWDDEQLAATLRELNVGEFDMSALGWTNEDLAALLNAGTPAGDTGRGGEPEDDDAAPVAPPSVPVTQPGDIWQLGPHRIICGDCRDRSTVDRLLSGARVNLAFTSPPYASQRTYDESSGFRPIPPADYVEWFADVAANVKAVLADDGSWFVNIKPAAHELDTDLYVFDLVLAHVRLWGWHFATEYCWERIGVPKNVTRRFKNQFEPVYQFVLGDWKMRPDEVRHPSNNIPVAGDPENRTPNAAPAERAVSEIVRIDRAEKRRKRAPRSVTGAIMSDGEQGMPGWSNPGEGYASGMAYPGNRLPTFGGSHDATGHTAAFPVGLPTFFLKAYTDPGDVVYDPFMGSGSTLLAAHSEQRAGYGCEISPGYVDVICRRFQRHTGIKPINAATGEPHDFEGASDG